MRAALAARITRPHFNLGDNATGDFMFLTRAEHGNLGDGASDRVCRVVRVAARWNQPKATHDVFPFGAVGTYAETIHGAGNQMADFVGHGLRHKMHLILAEKRFVQADMIRAKVGGASRATAQVECDARGGKVAPEKLARLGECFVQFGDGVCAVLHGKDLSR